MQQKRSSAPRSRRENQLLTVAILIACAGSGIAIVAALALGGAGSQDPTAAFHGTPFHEDAPAPDAPLVDHRGERLVLSDLRGEPALVFFGFTRCPDVCPLTLDKLTRARSRLSGGGEDVRIVLITVDPERDDPETLAQYVSAFGPGVIGATGDEQALERIYREYGVWARAEEGRQGGHAHHSPREMLVHSSPVYGLDREGRLRVVIPYGAPDEEVLHDMRVLRSL